jgi:2-dehydro-3-deoxyphosphogluconate aldolase/(4S)-4-hydroxy-2-oxoglutarate aldolase
MKDSETLKKINDKGVCAIVRGTSADTLKRIAESLLKGGVSTIEVTFNTPGAAKMIEELCKEYANDLLVGAGTVLDEETARIAILSGAKFVLAPTLNTKMIQTCLRYNVVPVPGVMTPTEALTAWEAGARIIKIFPAGILGTQYIKQLKGPLNQIDIMVVGAVGVSNLADFLKAGASSAGIGSELVSAKLVAEGKFDEITERAKTFLQIVADFRSGK